MAEEVVHMVDGRSFRVVETQKKSVIFVVQLIDDYTGTKVIGDIQVAFSGPKRPVRSLEGDYCFFTVQDGQYEITIDSEWYFSKTFVVDTASINDESFKKEVRLIPRPCYPFPHYATLLRGTLRGDTPFEEAELEVTSPDLPGFFFSTWTDTGGDFVLYIQSPEIRKINIVFKHKQYTVAQRQNVQVRTFQTVSLGRIKPDTH